MKMNRRTRFRAHPDSDFYFWAQDLVTDLRLYVWYNAGYVKVGTGYRHDCKHDMERLVRTAIHDAFSVQLLVPLCLLPICANRLYPRIGFDFEAELNVPPFFQVADFEPDKGRLSAECEFIPVSFFSGSLYAFVDGRGSCIYRESGGRVSADSALNFDGLVRVGARYKIGNGDIRLFYYYERLTDNWGSLNPSAEYISAVEFLISSTF